jgi:hypothetical protein
VRPRTMILLKIRGKNSSQMSLIQHNHMIQTLASDRTNQTFRIRVLPRRARRRNHFFDVHAADAPLEDVAIDAIAITNQKPRRRVVRKRLDDLLRCPSCRWMRSLRWMTCLRSWRNTTNANSMRNVAVGTVKKSMATMSVR